MAKSRRPKPPAPKPRPESVFQEAWENCRDDLARVLPASLRDKLAGGRRKWPWLVALTLVELLVLGVVGKWLYDWWTG